VIVAVPLINVHVPVLGAAGALAVMVTLGDVLQVLWSGPAFATGAAGLKRVIVTWSLVRPFAQGPLLKVHRNTFAPNPSPVTPEVGEVGVVIVPDPLTSIHCPVAGKIGALPASKDVLAHTC
jgi:hypothetical protein